MSRTRRFLYLYKPRNLSLSLTSTWSKQAPVRDIRESPTDAQDPTATPADRRIDSFAGTTTAPDVSNSQPVQIDKGLAI